MQFLNKCEDLAVAWQLVKHEKYNHRTKKYGLHDTTISEIPRNVEPHNILSLKTLLTSCIQPYAMTEYDN